jgi:hypothetical protein
MYRYDEALTRYNETMHRYGEVMYRYDEAMYRYGEAMHRYDEAMYQYDEAMHRYGEAMYRGNEAMYQGDESCAAYDEALSWHDGSIYEVRRLHHPGSEAPPRESSDHPRASNRNPGSCSDLRRKSATRTRASRLASSASTACLRKVSAARAAIPLPIQVVREAQGEQPQVLAAGRVLSRDLQASLHQQLEDAPGVEPRGRGPEERPALGAPLEMPEHGQMPALLRQQELLQDVVMRMDLQPSPPRPVAGTPR